MNCLEFINKTRKTIAEELNDVLDEAGLEPIEFFVKNGFDVIEHPFSIAVYSDSPEGDVYSQAPEAINGKVTVEFFLNDSADPISVEKIEEYFSAIAEYLSKRTFGESSLVSMAQILRMDTGAPCNEALFLLDCRIQSTQDAYFGIY